MIDGDADQLMQEIDRKKEVMKGTSVGLDTACNQKQMMRTYICPRLYIYR